MLRKSFVLLVVGTVMFFLCSISSADVPDSINYQGKLTTASGGCLNETVSMTFTIYSDDQGTVVDWTETQNSVIVKEGIFNVLLGSVVPLPALIFDGSAKYLGVQVESDPEMSPLKPMVTTAYAFHCATADSALNAPAAGIVSVDGVSNPGGDVDLIQQDAITISPNDGANTITFGETHSARTDNPHVVTAAQTGALVSVDGVSNAGGNVDFIAGTNITITPNDGANTVTFSSTAGGIGGSGTTNYIPKFTGSTTIGNSVIYETGGNVGIGDATPDEKFDVNGDAAIYGGICVDDADNCTPPADGHVKADAFDYSTAQTRNYVIGPADFTGGNPDVDDLSINAGIIWNQGASSTYIYAPVHLPEGATLTEVCVDGTGATNTWNLYRCDYRSTMISSIASGNVGDPGCQTFTHTILADSYYTLRISLGADDRIDGARIKYNVTVPLP